MWRANAATLGIGALESTRWAARASHRTVGCLLDCLLDRARYLEMWWESSVSSDRAPKPPTVCRHPPTVLDKQPSPPLPRRHGVCEPPIDRSRELA